MVLSEAGYRLIAFDHRGHGKTVTGNDGITSKTMASDYVAVLEHYGVKDGILMGHSMSGFLGLKALLEYPAISESYLCGLILLASTAGDGLRGAPQNRLQAPLLKSGLLKFISNHQTYGGLFGSSVFGTQPNGAEIDAFITLFFKHDHRTTAAVIRALCRESYYARLNEIHLPCLVVCGTKDRTTPPSHTLELAQRLPNAGLHWAENVGHMLPWESPETLINAIESLANSK